MAKKEPAKEKEEEIQGEGEEMDQTPLPQNMITPDQVEEIWNANDPLKDLFDLYTNFFNPEHSDEYDQVDDNKIKIIAEFQIYNLIFLKNDIKLDNSQISEVLELLWGLLAINKDGTIQDHSVPAEGGFQEALNSKFEEVKIALINKAKEGILSKENIKSIMASMKCGYFKHFRLIDFVLRNQQSSTLKKITLFYNNTKISLNLDEAKEIIEKAEEGEDAEGEEDDIDINKDPMDGLDERLEKVNLEDEEKTEVKQKLEEYNKEVKNKVGIKA